MAEYPTYVRTSGSGGITYTVDRTGVLTRPTGQLGKLFDSNISAAINDVMDRARSDIRNAIKKGKRQPGTSTERPHLRETIQLSRATPSMLYARVHTESPIMVFREKDTRAHIIEARDAKALRFVRRGKVVFAKRVNHPGTRGLHIWQKTDTAVRERLYRAIDRAIDSAFQGMRYVRRYFRA